MSIYHRVCEIFGFSSENDENKTEVEKKFGGLYIIYEEEGEDEMEFDTPEIQKVEIKAEIEEIDSSIVNQAACEEVYLKKYSSMRSVSTDYTENHDSDNEDYEDYEDSIDGENEETRHVMQTIQKVDPVC